MATVGLRGPALAFVGRRWLLWAFVVNKMEEKIEKKTHLGPKRCQTRRLGPFSSSWAFVGRHWPSLATQWLLWAFVGLRWPSTSPSRLGSLPVILHCDKALFVVCGGGEYIY